MERTEKQFYESPTATVVELVTVNVMVGTPFTKDYEFVGLDEII